MTLKQLMRSVARLGFESDIADTTGFYEAVGRALDIFYTERAVIKTVTATRLCPFPSKILPEFVHKGGTASTAKKLRGTAYSFATAGTGCYTVFDGDNTKTVNFSGIAEHRDIIESGEAIITFYGKFLFTVTEIAVFDTIISDDPLDVPFYYELFVINLKDKFPDFLSLASEIKTLEGKPVNAKEENGILYILSDYMGPVRLSYRCKSPDISNISLDAELDIPRECEPLLPFLTASLLWLDDDTDKAQYYMAIYRDMLSTLTLDRQGMQTIVYTTNGWA